MVMTSCIPPPPAFEVDPCKKLTREVDKFDGKVTIRSPLLDPVAYTKIINGSSETVYLSISVNGNILSVGNKGVIVLLKSGDKLTFDGADVMADVNYSGYGWTYYCFIPLKDNEIEKLINDPIVDAKLYIFEKSISYPERYSSYLKCISEMN